MRKTILNVAISLDGLIEGPNGEYDWCFVDQDYGMKAFDERIDAIFMGRKSFELVQTMGDDPYPGKTIYVFSRTLKKTPHGEAIISDNFQDEVERIKGAAGKDIWLFGGASLVTDFMNAGLVDELMLAVHPVILGSGKPLFANLSGRIPLTLTDAKTYSSGLVQLFYRR